MRVAELRHALERAFTAPTQWQKEAYGRFAHTLAAAAVIGAVTIMFTGTDVTRDFLWRIAGLAISAMVCLVAGVLLVEGE